MADPGVSADDPIARLQAKGGTLSVYDDYVDIQRSSRSMFEDKQIPMVEILDVEYSGGVITGHVQIKQADVEADDAGLFSHPIDENTLHFPRNRREAAQRVRDVILERMG